MKKKVISLANKLGKPYKQDRVSVWVEVPAKDIRKALEEARKSVERISDLSVYDAGKNRLEVTYRFFISGTVLNIKTSITAGNPRLPTCTGLFPGALLIEREQHEMFGLNFSGHPNLEKVLFADSTPEKPLRKKIAEKGDGLDNKGVKDAGKQE
jgi:NADH:ubiquinone oxidoreductase subunit C